MIQFDNKDVLTCVQAIDGIPRPNSGYKYGGKNLPRGAYLPKNVYDNCSK